MLPSLPLGTIHLLGLALLVGEGVGALLIGAVLATCRSALDLDSRQPRDLLSCTWPALGSRQSGEPPLGSCSTRQARDSHP